MLNLFKTFRKKQAIRSYLGRLRPHLVKRYGKRPHYTPRQVRAAIFAARLDISYDCYAYAIYSTQEDFRQYHEQAGESCDYLQMRSEVAEMYGYAGSVGADGTDAIDSADGIDFGDPTFGDSGDSGGSGGGYSGADGSGGGDSGGGGGGGGGD